MKSCFPVLLALTLLAVPACNPSFAAGWQTESRAGHSALVTGNYNKAAEYFVKALQDCRTARPAQSDPAFRELIYTDIPETVQSLSLKPATQPSAYALAGWKVAVCESLFGVESVPAIDARFDLMIGSPKAKQDGEKELLTRRADKLKERSPAQYEELEKLSSRKVQCYQQKVLAYAQQALTSSMSTIQRALGK